MTDSVMPMSASQARLWSVHNSAAIPARKAGARSVRSYCGHAQPLRIVLDSGARMRNLFRC